MPTTVPVYPLTLFYLTIGAFEPLEVLYCFSSRRPVGQVGWLLRVSLVRTNGWVSPRPVVPPRRRVFFDLSNLFLDTTRE